MDILAISGSQQATEQKPNIYVIPQLRKPKKGKDIDYLSDFGNRIISMVEGQTLHLDSGEYLFVLKGKPDDYDDYHYFLGIDFSPDNRWHIRFTSLKPGEMPFAVCIMQYIDTFGYISKGIWTGTSSIENYDKLSFINEIGSSSISSMQSAYWDDAEAENISPRCQNGICRLDIYKYGG